MRRAVCVFAFAVVGCASTSANEAFRSTATLVEARTARKITWNQGGADDAEVARRVRALLARELTVDAAVEVALLNNKGLQATYEDLSVAQADLVQAGLLQNPVFGAGVVFPVAGAARTGIDLSVSQDFLSVFLLAARKKVASSALRATEMRVADAVVRTTYEVQKAYYELSCAGQVMAMRRATLEAGEAAIDLARRQREAGNISELDLATHESAYERLRTDVARGEAEVLTARESLTRALGLWGADANFRVSATLPEIGAAEVGLAHLEAVAVARRLDLAAAREDAQAVAHALAAAKDARWLGSSTVGARFERAPEGFSVAGPNAGVELPLFDQKRAVIARLEAQLRAALDRETALAVDVRAEVRAARGRVVVARDLVERYAKVIVPLRRRVVALTQEHYNAMLLGAYQLLQVKQGEVDAYRELIESVRDYWVARADLERATGGALGPTPAPPPGAATKGPP